MQLSNLVASLPDHTVDLQANLKSVLASTVLTDQQKWGCFLACAYSIGEPHVLAAVNIEAASMLSVQARAAARIAAVTMATNTVYYGASHLIQNHLYRDEPSRLVADAQSNLGIEKADFELWALAVSALANCETCLNRHETALRRHGVQIEPVLAALRIAAVVNAASTTLRAEAAMAA